MTEFSNKKLIIDGYKIIVKEQMDSLTVFCDQSLLYAKNNPPIENIREENSKLKKLLDLIDQ
jgi:hypothetical protein